MPDIPVGQLLILMAFILVPVINLLLQRMQRRVGRQPPKEEPPRFAARYYLDGGPRTLLRCRFAGYRGSTSETVGARSFVEYPEHPLTCVVADRGEGLNH